MTDHQASLYRARVLVELKPGVLDPQGEAIAAALGRMGFDGVRTARQSKVIDLEVEAGSEADAKSQVTSMAEKLLANTVIERFSIELAAAADAA